MRKIIFVFVAISFFSFQKSTDIIVDKEEARKAFNILVDIRNNPTKYYKELTFLKNIQISKTKLIWNDTLAKVAEHKATDMAKRNYLAHIDPGGFGINYHIKKSGYLLPPDWTKNNKDNYFESIAAGIKGGEDAIKFLLIDSVDPNSFGHRKHLLGVGDWNTILKDVGIGYARRDSGSYYPNYVCIIIAAHSR